VNYKIFSNETKHTIVETTTMQEIRVFQEKDEAKNLMRFLNLGGAFDGWTPRFILKNIIFSEEKAGVDV
jgi:hypothetical protein